MWLLIVVFTTGVWSAPLQIGPFMEYSQCQKIQTAIEVAYASTSLGVDAKCINLQPGDLQSRDK